MAYQGLIDSGIAFTLYADGVVVPVDATGELSWDGNNLVADQFSDVEWTLFFPEPRDVQLTIDSYLAATYASGDKAFLISEPDTWASPWTQSSTTAFSAADKTAANVQMIKFYVGNGGSNLTDFSILIEVDITEDPQSVSYNCDCDDAYDSKTLAQMRTMLVRGLGYSAQADTLPPGMTELCNMWLEQAQMMVYQIYDLFRMERFYRWPLTTGVRFYDLPDNADSCGRKLDPHKIKWIGIEDGSQWQPLLQGIPPEIYTMPDQVGRPQLYEIRQCIELWPAPSDDTLTLRIKGNFGLKPFTDDTHVTTVDWLVIYFRALAVAKAHEGQPDAGNYIGMEQERIANLVAGSHMTRRYIPGMIDLPGIPRPIFLPVA